MTTKAGLIRQFHTILAKLNNPEAAKAKILSDHQVSSTKELTEYQLTLTIKALQEQVGGREGTIFNDPVMELWRRRVMAAIGQYLWIHKYAESSGKIKAIACRATECNNFNKIPKEKLRNCYYLFCSKNKMAVKDVEKIVQGTFVVRLKAER